MWQSNVRLLTLSGCLLTIAPTVDGSSPRAIADEASCRCSEDNANSAHAHFRLASLPAELQEPDAADKGDSPPTEPDDPKQRLAEKLRDAFWEKNDKKGLKRKAEPKLFESHDLMCQAWVERLSDEDLALLLLDQAETSAEQAKRAKELLREFTKASQEVAVRLNLARRISQKIIKSHWDGLATTGVLPSTFPEYGKEYEAAVENWFLARSLEDLKIFEKSRASEAERERADKITKELIEKIEEVKRKFEGNMR